MNSLETRVHGLEVALEEMSLDLAVSSGRFANPAVDACCKLAGAEFLRSKIWKRAEGRYSMPRLSSGSISSPKSVLNATDKDVSIEMFATSSRRFRHCGGGLFVNSLAGVQNNLKGHSEQYSSTTPNSMVQDAKRTQVKNVSEQDGVSPVRGIMITNLNNR